MIFDAFVVLSPRSTALMVWPAADPTPEALDDLDTLLSMLNYLGRSESWIEARVLRGVSGVEWNCTPASATHLDSSHELIQLACPIPASEYEPTRIGKGKKAQTLCWLDAISTGTDTIHKNGLSHPPAMKYVEYSRDSRCFEVSTGASPLPQSDPIHSVLYALDSKVLPSATQALEIAEQVRARLMGIHKTIAGFENVSHRFSGRASSVTPLTGHRHAFYLPQDLDGDGKLDHLLIRCNEPFDLSELQALDRLDDLWQRKGKPGIRCIPIRWGGEPLLHTLVRSVTPFVTVRHQKGEDFADWLRGEVVRECRHHGLPEPIAVRPMPSLEVAGGRTVRWAEFRRNRKEDPVRSGNGFVLEFAAPVPTPFSIGYGCHFGLGQFVAVK
jgi:CRISPR-associated protein Csb2